MFDQFWRKPKRDAVRCVFCFKDSKMSFERDLVANTRKLSKHRETLPMFRFLMVIVVWWGWVRGGNIENDDRGGGGSGETYFVEYISKKKTESILSPDHFVAHSFISFTLYLSLLLFSFSLFSHYINQN